jgi:Ca-activated chloride channel homolog
MEAQAMIINPIAPIWVLAIVSLTVAAVIGWQLVVNRARRRIALLWLSRLVMVALLLVIAIRPTIPGDGQGPSASGGLEVYLVVDTTSSMAAEDWDGEPSSGADAATRLDGVRSDIASIVDRLRGAQFSLVTFDAVAVQRVPLTGDDSAVLSAASVLRQEISAYSKGSSIDEPLGLLSTILADAAAQNPDQRRVLFYFGDGEQTSGTEPQPFDQLAPYLQGGAVLGYGTADGAGMRQFNGVDERVFGEGPVPTPTDIPPPAYIQDLSGAAPVPAVSTIDEVALRVIAGGLGIVYEHRSSATSTALATTGIEVGEMYADDGKPAAVTELYWILAIPLGLLGLLQIVAIGGAVAELRPARRRS